MEPNKDRITLTLLLVILFIIEGAIKLFLGFMMRPLAQWNEMLLSGVTNIVMAIVILAGWSGTLSWPLGLLLGMNMILFGASLLNINLNFEQLNNNLSAVKGY